MPCQKRSKDQAREVQKREHSQHGRLVIRGPGGLQVWVWGSQDGIQVLVIISGYQRGGCVSHREV